MFILSRHFSVFTEVDVSSVILANRLKRHGIHKTEDHHDHLCILPFCNCNAQAAEISYDLTVYIFQK